MIAPNDADGLGPVSPLAAECFGICVEAYRTSRILDYAEFCGMQEDGNGGSFQLWTLRKPLGPHPSGSTITRQTLEKYLFPAGSMALAGKYGSAQLPAAAADFEAVESPQKQEGGK
jgi:hypothetical protein